MKGKLEMKTQLNILLLCFLVISAGIFISTCKKEQTTTNHEGVYTLISVDGKSVPASISHEGATLQVSSGTFTINADGTCSSKIVFIPPSGTEIVREVTATYKKDGLKLTMHWKDAGETIGIIQENTFTMDNEGMVLVYKKQ